MSSEHKTKLSVAGVLITIGIVFGDIGTSPLYVFQAITSQGKNLSEGLVLGGLSAVIWTLILLATIKYVYFALNADNKGEGGIFALYALLKDKKAKWIIVPTLIGCASLMADGFITPAISISSAVEGLANINPNLPIMEIIIGIIFALFAIQQFGTVIIGKVFGPIMLIWFSFLLYLGITHLSANPTVLKALNPWWAYNLIVNVPGGFWVLGAVFLCSTGAEALYSDLGHCGKGNIRVSWGMMSVVLIIHYFGQAALALSPGFHLLPKQTIFYAMVPKGMLPFAVGIATAATIIASQALITGIFTLMNEAIKLKLWTNLKVKYPTDHQGQIYIPFINGILLVGCLLVLWKFPTSSQMEASYGLAITINMIMTSILLILMLYLRYPKSKAFFTLIFAVFFVVEGVFLFSNIHKIPEGGWFTLVLAIFFFSALFLFYKAKELRANITHYIPMSRVIPLLHKVRVDDKIPYEASNLVYPTRSATPDQLDSTVFYSLFKKRPRRAGIVWFLHIEIKSDPWGVDYSVNEIIDKHCYHIALHLGFKEEHRIEYMMRKIHRKMVEKGELEGKSVFDSVRGTFEEPDFKFIVLSSRVATDNKLTPFQIITIKAYRFIKATGLKAAEDFGLDKTNVMEEYVPINVTKQYEQELHEEFENYSCSNA
jgi:KUP system potassium uptake protein